jgi:hypothetical protein
MRAEAMGEDGQLTDWDRFASVEYLRLAVEDEPDEMQVRVMAAGRLDTGLQNGGRDHGADEQEGRCRAERSWPLPPAPHLQVDGSDDMWTQAAAAATGARTMLDASSEPATAAAGAAGSGVTAMDTSAGR